MGDPFVDTTPTNEAPHAPAAAAVKAPAPRKRGKWLWLLVAALAFGAGWVFGGAGLDGREKETLPPEPALSGDPSAVPVTVGPVTFRPVQRAVEGVGTVHGFEEVTLAAKVQGRVRKLHFDVADRVKPGELLLEIDPTDYELAVRQAEQALQVELAKLGFEEPPGSDVELGKVPSVMQAQTRLENAESRYERDRGLWNSRAVAREQYENSLTEYRAAQAEHAHQLLMAKSGLATIRMKQADLAVARQQLEDTRVRVPTPSLAVPGSAAVVYAVTQRSVAEGTLVQPATEVARLVIDQTLKLRVPVPERYSREVQVGQKAEVRTAAAPSASAGTVTRINPAVDPRTRTFEVEIQVPNPGGELKPGSFAKAAILTRLDREAATVPLDALVKSAGIHKVFLVEGGRAREVRVTPGVQTTEWVEITRPALPREAQVVTTGQTVLAEDTPVRVRAPEADSAGP